MLWILAGQLATLEVTISKWRLNVIDRFRVFPRHRRLRAHVGLFGTTQLHLRKPLTVACWSAAFPGFGHLLLNKNLRGYALILWEIYINQQVHLNQALVHSFNGQYQAARNAIDPSFMALYIPVYLFAIWDSYRTTVDLNKIYLLAERERTPFRTFAISVLEINYLDKRVPWIAAFWSLAIPGIGQLYLHRLTAAVFILAGTIVITSHSGLADAVHHLILGDIRASTASLNPQWLLYFPSFHLYSVYDAYTNAVENNKLFMEELKEYLKRTHQPSGKRIRFPHEVI